MTLKILLSEDNYPVASALEALTPALPGARIYCLGAAGGTRAPGIEFYDRREFESAQALANRLFLGGEARDFLFFLSSDVLINADVPTRLGKILETDFGVAGVNPLLLAEWTSDRRAAFLGMTFDFQKRLHYLHEGILTDNPLTRKERFFQLAHPGCLLIRSEDFKLVGGFNLSLAFLAFPALCLQILKFRPKGFACAAEVPGRLRYKFDSWSFCGGWDSILQRGRLDAGAIKSDYADFCRDDKIEYGIDAWLNEGPAQIPDLSADAPVKSWLEWRYHPKPTALLEYISALPPEERGAAVELARNRPASLPRAFRYYVVQAEQIKARAQKSDPALAGQIDLWHKKSARFHYGALKPGIDLLNRAGIYNCSLDVCPAVFDAWIEIGEKFERVEVGESWPEIAVVTPVWNPNPDFLRQALESVGRQTYSNWRLCVADDASTNSEIRPLLESFAAKYKRVKLIFREENGHICRATNSALEMVESPFVAFLDHDDLLAPEALAEVAKKVVEKPELGFIYSDDDRINEYNVRRNPVFKPDFDRDLFFTGHLSVYRTELIRRVGGLRIGLEGSQDQDLRLRVTEIIDEARIAHIPRILYHWRVHEGSTAGSLAAKPYVIEANRKVYLETATRTGRKAELAEKPERGVYRLLYYPRKRVVCSVVFLVDGKAPSGRLMAVVGELEKYADLEICALPLRKDSPCPDSCKGLPFVGENYVRACDEAAIKTNGDVIIFIDANLEPFRELRLEQLLELAFLPRIAMAGGNIWFGDRALNCGWYPNVNGLPFPLLRGARESEAISSAWGQLFMPRHALGAPLECMAIRREFCERFLDESFGDYATVDFGLRAMKQNKFVAMNPWVNWRASRLPKPPGERETGLLFEKWGREIASCGLRNPNLRAAPDNDWTLVF